MKIQLDRIPVTDLFSMTGEPGRYAVGRSAFYKRSQELQPLLGDFEWVNGQSMANAEQLQLLDAYDAAIKGKDKKRFLATIGLSDGQEDRLVESKIYQGLSLMAGVGLSPEGLALFKEISLLLKGEPSPKAQLLEALEFLEKAAAHGWVLSTQEVQEIAGFTPKGLSCQRHGYRFVQGPKQGRSRGWQIQKN